jgi:CDP-diacylglycerol--serine O-phosphatidyltransferase
VLKKNALVPTMLTLGNAVCGLAAIAYASRIGKVDSSADDNLRFMAMSGWLIVGAMLFDTLDGFFARLFKAAGRFGAELDSLCDAISFGVAPAFLLLQLGPDRIEHPGLHKLLAGVATLYMMCTILRLARYNVEAVEGSKKFRGLPSPAAAGCIASLAVVRGMGTINLRWPALDVAVTENLIEAWATAGAAVVAILRVSNVAYPHLTKQMLRGKRSQPLALIFPILLAAVVLREIVLVVAFWAYAVSFAVRAVWVRLLPDEPSIDDAISRRA